MMTAVYLDTGGLGVVYVSSGRMEHFGKIEINPQ